MIRKACFSIGFLIVLASASGCAKETLEERLKTFQGDWEVINLERSGQKSDDEALKHMKVTIEHDNWKFLEGRGPGMVKQLFIEECVVQLDPSKPVGDIDLTYRHGENQGMTRSGIYEFENDKLKVCFGEVAQPRPTQFASTAEPPSTLIVLQRKQANP